MGLGVGLVEADDVDAARLGVGGFTVILDIPLPELAKELTRLSSLVMVTRIPVLTTGSMR
jgi:hypothetical protein